VHVRFTAREWRDLFMKLKVWKILVLLITVVFVLSTANFVNAAPTLTPTSTISSVSGTLAYDSGKGEIFALDASGTVSVISESTNKVSTTITKGLAYGPAHEIAYDSGKGEIFVSSGTPNGEGETPTVTVISDSTNTVLTSITSHSWWTPWGMTYDSKMGEIFLCDAGNNGNVFGTVYVISDTSNTVLTSIQVGKYPKEAVYDSGMNEIFVVNTGGTVSVISDSTNTVIATINVGTYPYGIAYDPNKGEVFVYNEYDGTVSVISDSSNTVVETVTGVAPSTVYPVTMAFDSSKGELFVSDSVISDTTNTIVAHLPAGLGNMVYASGKGEVIGSSSTGLSVFSDSSSPSPTGTTAPSPTVPEFSNTMLITISTAMIVVTICAIAITRRKSAALSHNPK
jgi:YVTN family beta-propeller protein